MASTGQLAICLLDLWIEGIMTQSTLLGGVVDFHRISNITMFTLIITRPRLR